MLVYFHIDEVARDSIVASALNRQLRAIGGRLIYGNRFSTAHLLRYHNCFDAIILPSLPHYVLAFPDPLRLPNNVFILQTEAVGQATGTLRRLHAKYFGIEHEKCVPWHQSVAGFFLWGYSHLNAFTEHYPEYLSHVTVVGHPRLASICSGSARDTTSNKKTIGFVSRFSLLNPFDSRFPFESVANGMRFGKGIYPLFENSPTRDIEDLFYTEVIDLRIMLQIIQLLDADKYDISVRPHPRENPLAWKHLSQRLKLNITVSQWDEPFTHWLRNIDIVITPPSTSLYDAYFLKKKVIVIDNIVPSRSEHLLTESDDNNQILKASCRPKSAAEAIDFIESGCIPLDESIVEKCLYEQVANDIATDSIGNIINCLCVFEPTIAKAIPVRYLRAQTFSFLLLILSSSLFLYTRLLGRNELGSSFFLTPNRILWINRLIRIKRH
jgi:surface carbohydrate biosynthesis protein